MTTSLAGSSLGMIGSCLAWCGRRKRRHAWFWLGLGVFTLGWQLDLPGVVSLLRVPGLNMMSHNRFVFATSFAILTLAVIALDSLAEEAPQRRLWFALPAGLVLVLGVVCVVRGSESEGLLAARLAPRFAPGGIPPEMLRETHTGITRTCLWSASLCLVALAGWWLIGSRRQLQPWFAPLLGLGMVTELLVFAWDLNPQCDPRLYYPRLEILEKLAHAQAGRVLGVGCLPANLHESYGLREIRGDDGIDPRRLVEVLDLARDKRTPTGPSYAILENYVPTARLTSESTVEVPRILDMLNVRYLLFAGPPREGLRPRFEGNGYFVMENPSALPRVFIPRRVRMVPDERQIPALLAAPDFDPHDIAYVGRMESPPADAHGTAEIVEEVPTSVRVAVDMQTPGMLVLADEWYEGWHAHVNERPVPILRANHVLRGVEVPAGRSTVLFRYEPESLTVGVRLLSTGLLTLVVYAIVCCWRSGRASSRYW